MASRLRRPFLYVEIDNKDVSAYITPFLLEFNYLDNDGVKYKESDDIQITVYDKDAFFSNNPPARGSQLKVKFGYEDFRRDAGVFYIDSYEFDSSRAGDTINIKALAKDVKKSFRTIKSVGFENTSLKKIAQKIADDNGYKLNFVGDDLSFHRITQYQKRDLEFLSELCERFGYTCKVNSDTIIIRDIQQQAKSNSLYILDRSMVISLSISVSSLYEKSVEVVYLKPDLKTNIKSEQETDIKATGDTRKINVRVENKEQAERATFAAKLLDKLDSVSGNLTCVGIPNLYASGNFILQGFNKFDGKYYIKKVEHVINRSGYICNIEFCSALEAK